MTFLAIEKDVAGVTPDAYAPHLRAEAARVWQLQQSEIVRGIWFADPDRRAVVLLECADQPAAEAALASLPLVQARCLAFDVMRLRPYDGFERLFAR